MPAEEHARAQVRNMAPRKESVGGESPMNALTTQETGRRLVSAHIALHEIVARNRAVRLSQELQARNQSRCATAPTNACATQPSVATIAAQSTSKKKMAPPKPVPAQSALKKLRKARKNCRALNGVVDVWDSVHSNKGHIHIFLSTGPPANRVTVKVQATFVAFSTTTNLAVAVYHLHGADGAIVLPIGLLSDPWKAALRKMDIQIKLAGRMHGRSVSKVCQTATATDFEHGVDDVATITSGPLANVSGRNSGHKDQTVYKCDMVS